jgi:hypothetical protein
MAPRTDSRVDATTTRRRAHYFFFQILLPRNSRGDDDRAPDRGRRCFIRYPVISLHHITHRASRISGATDDPHESHQLVQYVNDRVPTRRQAGTFAWARVGIFTRRSRVRYIQKSKGREPFESGSVVVLETLCQIMTPRRDHDPPYGEHCVFTKYGSIIAPPFSSKHLIIGTSPSHVGDRP